MNTFARQPSGSDQRIDMDQAHQVRYWCAAFDITREQLRHAVEVVGTSVPKLGEYLRTPPGSTSTLPHPSARSRSKDARA